jgi:hypothetical protein
MSKIPLIWAHFAPNLDIAVCAPIWKKLTKVTQVNLFFILSHHPYYDDPLYSSSHSLVGTREARAKCIPVKGVTWR